jgi:Uma2 family endonuclease
MSTPYTWTYSEYARFPDDGNRYEVIDGEVLVTPAPTTWHQLISGRLFTLLGHYCDQQSIGWVFYDVDLLFQTGQFLRPDLVIVPTASREGLTDRGVELPPELIVEIVSPTSASIDRVKKPRRYGDFGVPEYWAVDAHLQAVDVWRYCAGATEPERVTGQLYWQPPGAAEPLVIDLAALFAPL